MICNVHKNSREVCDHENAPSFPVELHADLDLVIDVGLDAPALYDVLTKLLLSLVDDLLRVHDGQVAVSSLEVKLETAELISKGIKLDVIEQTRQLYPLGNINGERVFFTVVNLTNVELVNFTIQLGLTQLCHKDLLCEGADYEEFIIEFYLREPNFLGEVLR